MKTIYADGTPVPVGSCVAPSTFSHTFIVTVNSMSGVSEQQIKDLIQAKLKVTQCKAQGEPICLVRETM